MPVCSKCFLILHHALNKNLHSFKLKMMKTKDFEMKHNIRHYLETGFYNFHFKDWHRQKNF